MFERFRERRTDDRATYANGAGEARDGGGVATAEREEHVRHARGDDRVADERRHEEFGGINWGSSFFGWLVAIGLAAILTAIVSATGAAVGLTEVSDAEAEANAETIGLIGAILLLAILWLAYYAGGYVAGRMSRFDGGRQGLGVWVIGLVATILLAVAGVIGGAEYNVLERLNLPRIPVDEGDMTAGALITLALVIVGTLIAAMAGGKVGRRYHHKVDRAGYAD
jgi:hypothetical protein